MDEKKLRKIIKQVNQVLKASLITIALLLIAVIYLGKDYFLAGSTQKPKNEKRAEVSPEIVDGIHVETGLKDAPGLKLVIQNCTSCHSSKLIIQNKMNLARWESTIKWMQETQNLWDLGENESAIVEYLAANYAPKKKGRRSNLEDIEWYKLE